MTTYNGFQVCIHEITEEHGQKFAVVNKGEEKTKYTFRLKIERIEGLTVA